MLVVVGEQGARQREDLVDPIGPSPDRMLLGEGAQKPEFVKPSIALQVVTVASSIEA